MSTLDFVLLQAVVDLLANSLPEYKVEEEYEAIYISNPKFITNSNLADPDLVTQIKDRINVKR